MADEQADVQQPQQKAVVVEQKPASEAELQTQMDAALKTKDFKIVAKVAAELVKFQKAKDAVELDAKQKALATITDKVKVAITKTLKPLVDAGELDMADGIWFSHDFGEKLETCRLMRSAPRATRAGGGGGGKKFDVNTNDLLDKFGNDQYGDKGMTYLQAWESNTDKNWRYAIRQSLLKKAGVIS